MRKFHRYVNHTLGRRRRRSVIADTRRLRHIFHEIIVRCDIKSPLSEEWARRQVLTGNYVADCITTYLHHTMTMSYATRVVSMVAGGRSFLPERSSFIRLSSAHCSPSPISFLRTFSASAPEWLKTHRFLSLLHGSPQITSTRTGHAT